VTADTLRGSLGKRRSETPGWSFLSTGLRDAPFWTKAPTRPGGVAVTGTQRDGKKITRRTSVNEDDDRHFSFRFIDRRWTASDADRQGIR